MVEGPSLLEYVMHQLALLACALVLVTPLSAQQPGGGRGRGMMGPSLEELTTRLKLDSSQVVKIRPLLEKFIADTKGAREVMMANMQAVRNGETTRDAVQAETQAAMMVIRDNRELLNQGIRACLTPEQLREFDSWLAEEAARRQQQRRPPS